MMPPRLWQLSAPPCARKWTWSRYASSCLPSSRRRCSLPMSRCGCVHPNTTEHSGLLGEPLLLFPLKKYEEVRPKKYPHVQALRMKGDFNDGNQRAVLCPAHPCLSRRVSTTRSLLSALGAHP